MATAASPLPSSLPLPVLLCSAPFARFVLFLVPLFTPALSLRYLAYRREGAQNDTDIVDRLAAQSRSKKDELTALKEDLSNEKQETARLRAELEAAIKAAADAKEAAELREREQQEAAAVREEQLKEQSAQAVAAKQMEGQQHLEAERAKMRQEMAEQASRNAEGMATEAAKRADAAETARQREHDLEKQLSNKENELRAHKEEAKASEASSDGALKGKEAEIAELQQVKTALQDDKEELQDQLKEEQERSASLEQVP